MIDVRRISDIVRDCLFREGEDTSTAVLAEGIVRKFGFHPDRLKGHQSEIVAMLEQLPEEFHNDGWSFLNACIDRDGNQWGEQRDVEELFALGGALGIVKCQMPRDMWSMLPGGVPYYTIIGLDTEINVQPVAVVQED